jgi:hypothetical protein
MILPLLVGFLALEAPLLYLEWRAGQRAGLRVRPGTVLLIVAAINHGVFRVLAFHPAFRKGYRTWLESTPWTYRKPLPLGPVELAWEDGLFLGPLILLSATLPEPHAVQLLCIFLLTNLLALTLSFWLTRSWAFGYSTALALGLAVWLWRQPIACLAILTAVYLIAYEGLRRALAGFPWDIRTLPNLNEDLAKAGWRKEPCGWPHDRMMGDIVQWRGISRIDALLICMLSGWWFYVLVSLIEEPPARIGLSAAAFSLAMVAAPLARIGIYTTGYASPIGFWGRIWTARWIIPDYDRVFVAPLCALIAGPATAVFLRACSAPEPIRYTIAAAMVILVATLTPPRLGSWRLTGRHRIVNTIPSQNQQNAFVKVG